MTDRAVLMDSKKQTQDIAMGAFKPVRGGQLVAAAGGQLVAVKMAQGWRREQCVGAIE